MTDILDYLKAGESLTKGGNAIYSPNGIYHFSVWSTGEIGVSTEEIVGKTNQTHKVWSNGKKSSKDCFVCMQKDCNLVEYEVIAPSQNKPIWSNGTYKKADLPFFLMVEDDGSLSIYSGNDIKSKVKKIWSNNNLTKFKLKSYTMESINYDISKAIKHQTFEVSIYSLEVKNDTDLEQESNITHIVSFTNEQAWSNTLSESVTVESGVTVSIACVEASGKVGIEDTKSTTFSQSSTTTYQFEVTGTIKVPPHKKYKIDIRSVVCELEVPYSLKGVLHFDKLADCRGDHIRGTFTGKNAISVSAYYSEVDENGKVSEGKRIDENNITITKLH